MMLRSLLLTASAALAVGACDERTSGDSAALETASATSPAYSADAATPVRPETRKFRDWLAVCDNGNACSAFGPAASSGGWIRVTLDAGPAARPQVHAGLVDRAAGPEGLTLSVDGQRFALTMESDSVGRIQDPTPGLIDALAKGRRLSLGDDVALSPSGAAAALLWIDERQGRLGTAGALVRRGATPASSVPAAPALPRVVSALAVAQTNLPSRTLPAAFEARADVKQCRADTAYSPTFQSNVTVDRLAADQELWGVPCFSGAYNFGLRYFVTEPNGANPQPVRFPTSREPADEVVNGEYDPTSRTLTAFNKGRGVGDCGIASVWAWTGRDFALVSESEMRECWGVPADLWPSTWRSR
ncbi:DUF1176 domain-containing protein [Brevundimonas sp.]|uniref:DUF1176 domain-containing protein n=1 Tax=Brevundimonas sp. TaxID=1871086 RepID=UPI00289F12B9|nr:DUF1176 domain-containing protein [Brevundimonas sp.]